MSGFFRPRHGVELLLFVLGSVVVAALGLAVLHGTPTRFKRQLIVVCTFVAGLYYVLEFFLPAGFGHPRDPSGNLLSPWSLPIGNALLVIGAFTFGLGMFNLGHIHWNAIRRLRPGWYNSLAFFFGFFAMAIAGFWHDHPHAPGWVVPAYQLLFRGLWQNLGATMFSLLAFFIASAAYRAFRVRSGEAVVLMLTALILMLGQVPIGMALTSWVPMHRHLPFFGTPTSLFRIENFSRWVLMRINNPVQRAIDFGIGLGGLAMGIRIWLSIERGTYFGD